MSFMDTLKNIGTVVLDTVKENPVASAVVGGSAVVVIGTGIYAHRRIKAAKAGSITINLGDDTPKPPKEL